MHSQDCSVTDVGRLLRKHGPDALPENLSIDFSEATPKQFSLLIRELIKQRRTTVRRFTTETQKVREKFIRIPPSMRKRL